MNYPHHPCHLIAHNPAINNVPGYFWQDTDPVGGCDFRCEYAFNINQQKYMCLCKSDHMYGQTTIDTPIAEADWTLAQLAPSGTFLFRTILQLRSVSSAHPYSQKCAHMGGVPVTGTLVPIITLIILHNRSLYSQGTNLLCRISTAHVMIHPKRQLLFLPLFLGALSNVHFDPTLQRVWLSVETIL